MSEQKTYIEELREKESSFGKIFKVSGPRKICTIQLSSRKEWEELKCINWSKLAMINL